MWILNSKVHVDTHTRTRPSATRNEMWNQRLRNTARRSTSSISEREKHYKQKCNATPTKQNITGFQWLRLRALAHICSTNTKRARAQSAEEEETHKAVTENAGKKRPSRVFWRQFGYLYFARARASANCRCESVLIAHTRRRSARLVVLFALVMAASDVYVVLSPTMLERKLNESRPSPIHFCCCFFSFFILPTEYLLAMAVLMWCI